MKISIIGPGIMPIPPTGWGAVEILIWDYYTELTKNGVDVQIVNNRDYNQIITNVNTFNPDFVHLQYDDYYDVLKYINCSKIAATSHYGYIKSHNGNFGGYQRVFNNFVNGNHFIFALSSDIKNVYVQHGFDPNKIIVTPNGANEELFRYSPTCLYTDKSIYLAKIDYRKRQYLFQNISSIHFAGNCADYRFNTNLPNYLGEWSKTYLYDNLTNYANLILLSDGEAHALVCCEALMCGLGLVVSEAATANLDLTKPFIDVIPENRINDLNYVESVIINNREKSIQHREEIREYALENFAWKKLVSAYINNIGNL